VTSPSPTAPPQNLLTSSQVDNVHQGDNQMTTTLTTLTQDTKVTFEILTTPPKHLPATVLLSDRVKIIVLGNQTPSAN